VGPIHQRSNLDGDESSRKARDSSQTGEKRMTLVRCRKFLIADDVRNNMVVGQEFLFLLIFEYLIDCQ
jgi:hypothetical protein